MTQNTKDIYDIVNPDRGLCSVDACNNLQRNHGNKRWGKFCDKHHNEPMARAERKRIRALHRKMVKAEIAARNIERRKNLQTLTISPPLCSKCGQLRSVVDWGNRRTRCKPCDARIARERTLKKKYGIDGVRYNAMLRIQGGVCYMWPAPKSGKSFSC